MDPGPESGTVHHARSLAADVPECEPIDSKPDIHSLDSLSLVYCDMKCGAAAAAAAATGSVLSAHAPSRSQTNYFSPGLIQLA